MSLECPLVKEEPLNVLSRDSHVRSCKRCESFDFIDLVNAHVQQLAQRTAYASRNRKVALVHSDSVGYMTTNATGDELHFINHELHPWLL